MADECFKSSSTLIVVLVILLRSVPRSERPESLCQRSGQIRCSRLTLCSFQRTWFANIRCLLFVHRIAPVDQTSATCSMSIHRLIRSIFVLMSCLWWFVGRASYAAAQRVSSVGIADFPVRRRSGPTNKTQLFHASFMHQHLLEFEGRKLVLIEWIKRCLSTYTTIQTFVSLTA